jgi:glycopeptide antibiotics resistance protein
MGKSWLKKVWPYIYLTSFLAVTGVIFLFASFSGEVSGAQSNFFVDLIVTFLGWFGFQLDAEAISVLSLIVRKLLGHFLIFWLDGVLAYLTAISFIHKAKWWLPPLIAGAAMILVASVSEIIQLFASDRAGTFIDVILDSAGALLGILISLWINRAYQRKKEITI